jgi:hypothetical protein
MLTQNWNMAPYNKWSTDAGRKFCTILDGKFCKQMLSFMADTDASIDDTSRWDMYLSNAPSGASWRALFHYSQLIDLKTPTFRQYDYGAINN